jgi:hypothetical protein
MSNFSEMKEFIDYTFYKMESDVKGFDENLQKFKEELFTYCEQLGFKTEKYVGVHHLVEFTVKDENNRDYDVTLFSFDYKIKNKMSYLYLDDTVRGILKHRKDDMFIYLERNDDTLYNCNLGDKLIEYKKLATDWAKILKERKIDKKKAELEQDFVNDDVSEDESVADVQVEKDSSDKPLPIYKRFAKNLLNVFKKDSK